MSAIKVLFFASLRERFKQSEVLLPVETALNVQAVWERATQNASLPNNTLVSVNQSYANLQTPVHAGDEVAFFPPVTGGYAYQFVYLTNL